MTDVKEKEIQETLIKELKDYRALKVKLENLKERREAGVIDPFPSLLNSDILDELKVKQIERGLKESLDPIERGIIELKYLNHREINDIEIFMSLGLKKGKYYAKKNEAIRRLSKALGII
ncbi:ArpU family phage packaging/lysis transcriptional regulator [Sporosarcina globispora]|uniref:ArpU family phage packaging/lysis transcriptional regulator n=1 Tax=Sporosarcina globispora TaxID=1459 RepID=UPI000A49718F